MSPRHVVGLSLSTLLAVALVTAAGAGYRSFPGSNGQIAFVRDPACESGPNPPCDRSTIYVVSTKGGRAKPLIEPFGVGVSDPAWSPFGSRVAFVGDLSIWIADADGRGRRRITERTAGLFQPAWSPDGTKLLFNDDNTSIGVMNADGSGRQSLVHRVTVSRPTWSPDGRKILFECGPDVCLMDGNGKHVRHVLIGAAFPSWAPDGKSIAYVSSAGLTIATADGARRRLLVKGPISQLSWSPDGKALAYTVHAGPPGVYVVSVDGRRRVRLTGLQAIGGAGLDWQPRR